MKLPVFLALFLCFTMTQPVFAAQKAVATLVVMEGSASVTRAGKTSDLKEDDTLYLKDKITTGDEANLLVMFYDETEMTLGENGTLTIDEYVYNPQKPDNNKGRFAVLGTAFAYVSGQLAHSLKRPDVEIETAYGSIGIRGTKFAAGPLDGKYSVFVEDGAVDVWNDAGRVTVGKNQGTKIHAANSHPTYPGEWSTRHLEKLKNQLRFTDYGHVRSRMKAVRDGKGE